MDIVSGMSSPDLECNILLSPKREMDYLDYSEPEYRDSSGDDSGDSITDRHRHRHRRVTCVLSSAFLLSVSVSVSVFCVCFGALEPFVDFFVLCVLRFLGLCVPFVFGPFPVFVCFVCVVFVIVFF